MSHVVLYRLLVDVEALVRDGGILSSVVLQNLVAAGVPSAPVGHVVNVAVDDDPEVSILLVLGHLLSRQNGKRAAMELGNGRRHLAATVTSLQYAREVTLATPLAWRSGRGLQKVDKV